MDTTNTSVTATERYKLNKELAQMLKGGVIMDVTTPEQAPLLRLLVLVLLWHLSVSRLISAQLAVFPV